MKGLVKLALSYLMAVFFLSLGSGLFLFGSKIAIIYLIIGVLFIPPIRHFVSDKTGASIPLRLIFILGISSLFLAGVANQETVTYDESVNVTMNDIRVEPQETSNKTLSEVSVNLSFSNLRENSTRVLLEKAVVDPSGDKICSAQRRTTIYGNRYSESRWFLIRDCSLSNEIYYIVDVKIFRRDNYDVIGSESEHFKHSVCPECLDS